jgi:hypothetical protein
VAAPVTLEEVKAKPTCKPTTFREVSVKVKFKITTLYKTYPKIEEFTMETQQIEEISFPRVAQPQL